MAIGASGAISVGNGGSGSNTLNTEFGRSANAPTECQQFFNGTYTLNITNLNANKPSGSTPYKFSDFYKYEHVVAIALSNGNQSFSSSGGTGTTSSVTHAQFSTWYVSNKPTWVTITSGNFGSSNKDTGDGSVTFTVSSNSGSSRTGTIQVTYDVGTTGGGVGDANSTTTRNITVSQSAGSGGGGGGGGGGGLPPRGGGPPAP